MEEKSAETVCGEEALHLLNCVAQSPYDRDKCLRLLDALRECVVNKKVKKFSLANQEQKQATPATSKKV